MSSTSVKKILVVDDDLTVTKIIHTTLTSHGYEVLTAHSGEDGLSLVKEKEPDVVILDVLLPKMKGREVCKKIKDDPTTRHIPVVFLTAKDSPDDVQAEMAAGAVGHLTKPVHVESLISTIQKILI